jgi:hypothetical protein
VVFDIPRAQVGGIVEYRYKKIYNNPNFITPWLFGRRFPVARAELNIVADAGIKFDYRYGRGEKLVEIQPVNHTIEKGQERLMFVELNLPPYYDEPAMPHLARHSPWVGISVTAAEVSGRPYQMRTWYDLAAQVKKWAKDMEAPPKASGDARVRYVTLRDKLNMVDLVGLGNLPFTKADKLAKGEPTSTRDAALLLQKSMLKRGLKAYVVLATSPMTPPLFESFPAFYPFARALVAIPLTDDLQEEDCSNDPLARKVLCMSQLSVWGIARRNKRQSSLAYQR